MLFRVVDKAKWNENEWDYFINLVQEFKEEYGYTLESVDRLKNDSYCFSLGNYHIQFVLNGQGAWITLESNTDKQDFDEKFNFIFARTK